MSEGHHNVRPVQFGTFTGVFTPTLLTILGVILYVRVGWVVGNAGLLGGWIIMAVALVITACTGLSLSSIASNTRMGPGGPYAVVSRSLGLEVAGSIGIPLYLTRPLGIAMYVFGFREGWQWIFPSHPALAIDLIVFAVLFLIAYRSADLAFRVQYLIMAIIGASLLSILLGSPTTTPVASITWWGEYPGFPEQEFAERADFWTVFAVFFPATTGILAGANMSGDLADPRRSIPSGTLWAIALASVVYFAVAWWAARAGTMEELATNYNLVIDRAAFPPAVLAGLLGATFSSALAGLVGGPRILMAMGDNKLLPFSRWISTRSEDGEPRNSSLITGVLTLACLMLRDLNAIAPLVTMFFLITYCIINVVVLFEQGLGLVSFRPSLRVPLLVPLTGTVGTIFAMFIVNPTFGLLAVGMVVAVYLWLQRFVEIGAGSSREARSSLFVALAEFAARHTRDRYTASLRAWKPSLLIPVEDPETIRRTFDLVCDVALPEGSVKMLGLATDHGSSSQIGPPIEALGKAFQGRHLHCSWSTIDTTDAVTGTSAGLQALQSAFFRPNLLFLTLPDDPAGYEPMRGLVALARRTGVGTFLVALHPEAGLGQRRTVTLWIRNHPGSWDPLEGFQGRNLNLTLLMGYRLWRQWGCDLRLVTVVSEPEERPDAERFLAELCDLARIPKVASRLVMVGTFEECVEDQSSSDLHIMGLQPDPDFAFIQRMVVRSRSTCVFVVDSGRESALS